MIGEYLMDSKQYTNVLEVYWQHAGSIQTYLSWKQTVGHFEPATVTDTLLLLHSARLLYSLRKEIKVHGWVHILW